MEIYNGYNEPIIVSEKWHNILLEADRKIANNDKAQTRRHCSLNALNLDGALIPTTGDVPTQVIRRDEIRRGLEVLTSEQRSLVRRVYVEGYKMCEIAKEDGVSVSAVSQRLSRALKRMRKVLKD